MHGVELRCGVRTRDLELSHAVLSQADFVFSLIGFVSWNASSTEGLRLDSGPKASWTGSIQALSVEQAAVTRHLKDVPASDRYFGSADLASVSEAQALCFCIQSRGLRSRLQQLLNGKAFPRRRGASTILAPAIDLVQGFKIQMLVRSLQLLPWMKQSPLLRT